MKNLLLAANWKSNKTKNEARNWIEEFSLFEFPKDLEVIIFPPFTLLDMFFGYIKVNSLPLKLGAQNISPFDKGPYTGEISGEQIKEFADYVLIGHSERRINFKESDDMVAKKIEQAISKGIIPIVCISKIEQLDNLPSRGKIVIAYEPPGSISTSGPEAKAENPGLVEEFAKKIKEKIDTRIIYGGSVDEANIKDYIGLNNIEGALIGGQSLDPNKFINIIKNVI